MNIYTAIATIEKATATHFDVVKINAETLDRETALARYGSHTLEEYSEWEIEQNLNDFVNFSELFGFIGLDTVED